MKYRFWRRVFQCSAFTPLGLHETVAVAMAQKKENLLRKLVGNLSASSVFGLLLARCGPCKGKIVHFDTVLEMVIVVTSDPEVKPPDEIT